MKYFDGHNDHVLKISHGKEFYTDLTGQSHMDYKRLKQSGFLGGFFALFAQGKGVFTNFEKYKTRDGYKLPLAKEENRHLCMDRINELYKRLVEIEKYGNGMFRFVKHTHELEQCIKSGVMAGIIHMEGAEAIDPTLHNLPLYYAAGLRSIGLVWSRPNAFATGVPYHFPSSPDIGEGLTKAGEELVKACNKLGIMIDLSHINEKGFWDVSSISRKPLVATHSNAHALCPIARNLTDAQLDAIGKSGGVVGVTYSVNMVRADGLNDPRTPLEEIVNHIAYIGERIGYDHVALGSDFDGARIPEEMNDARGVEKLESLCIKAGLTTEQLEKIYYKNWLRILQQTWNPSATT